MAKHSNEMLVDTTRVISLALIGVFGGILFIEWVLSRGIKRFSGKQDQFFQIA